jgi:hypothetical protein
MGRTRRPRLSQTGSSRDRERVPRSYTNHTTRSGVVVTKSYRGPDAPLRCAHEAAVLTALSGRLPMRSSRWWTGTGRTLEIRWRIWPGCVTPETPSGPGPGSASLAGVVVGDPGRLQLDHAPGGVVHLRYRQAEPVPQAPEPFAAGPGDRLLQLQPVDGISRAGDRARRGREIRCGAGGLGLDLMGEDSGASWSPGWLGRALPGCLPGIRS